MNKKPMRSFSSWSKHPHPQGLHWCIFFRQCICSYWLWSLALFFFSVCCPVDDPKIHSVDSSHMHTMHKLDRTHMFRLVKRLQCIVHTYFEHVHFIHEIIIAEPKTHKYWCSKKNFSNRLEGFVSSMDGTCVHGRTNVRTFNACNNAEKYFYYRKYASGSLLYNCFLKKDWEILKEQKCDGQEI